MVAPKMTIFSTFFRRKSSMCTTCTPSEWCARLARLPTRWASPRWPWRAMQGRAWPSRAAPTLASSPCMPWRCVSSVGPVSAAAKRCTRHVLPGHSTQRVVQHVLLATAGDSGCIGGVPRAPPLPRGARVVARRRPHRLRVTSGHHHPRAHGSRHARLRRAAGLPGCFRVRPLLLRRARKRSSGAAVAWPSPLQHKHPGWPYQTTTWRDGMRLLFMMSLLFRRRTTRSCARPRLTAQCTCSGCPRVLGLLARPTGGRTARTPLAPPLAPASMSVRSSRGPLLRDRRRSVLKRAGRPTRLPETVRTERVVAKMQKCLHTQIRCDSRCHRAGSGCRRRRGVERWNAMAVGVTERRGR